MTARERYQKVTFQLPADLKESLNRLKEEMGVSLSAIYTEALREYVKKQEARRWREAALKARKEYETAPQALQNLDQDGFYEY